MSLSIEINGVSVNVTQGAGGMYFFQMAHMLRAAGLPEGLGFAMWAGADKSGYGMMSLDGVSMGHPVRFITIEGYRAYVGRMRARVESGSMEAGRRRNMKMYLQSLERCLSTCEDWVRARESGAADGRFDQVLDVSTEPDFIGESAFMGELAPMGPEPAEESEPSEGPEPSKDSAACSARRVFTEGPVPDAMMAALLAKLPLLCDIFGIGPELSREEQLLRLLWLMAFHDRERIVSPAWKNPDSCSFRLHLPAGRTVEAAPLWDGHLCRDVEDLVKAAMLG